MFVKSKGNYLVTKRIEFTAEDYGFDAFLVLREPTNKEMSPLRAAYREGESAIHEALDQMIPELIIDHDFYEDETTKMDNAAVRDMLMEKGIASVKVVNEYLEAVFRPLLRKFDRD